MAIDWLRGLVMMLMALDHVDAAGNGNHVQNDGAMFPQAEMLSVPDYTIRWFTHLCAPTFVLLAGVSVVLSARNAIDRGASNWQIDRHLLLRGGLIVALELIVVSMYWRAGERMPVASLLPTFPLVLWAIGGSLMLMPLFRRLPDRWLLGTAAALLIAMELAPTASFGINRSLPTTVFVTGGLWWSNPEPQIPPDVICLYPLLCWLPVMLLGLVLGRRLASGKLTINSLVIAGIASLVLFLTLRGINGFGNMQLFRRSHDVLEWLHCSKYPPSITFLALELGLAMLILAVLLGLGPLLERVPAANPLGLLGRVPLFYYLVHLPMIGLLIAIGLLPQRPDGSAALSLLGMCVVVVACWPLCGAYARYKRRYRHAWTRYL